MSPPRCERWKGLLPVLVHCPVARGIVGDLKGLVEQRVGLHLPRVRVLVAAGKRRPEDRRYMPNRRTVSDDPSAPQHKAEAGEAETEERE